MRSTLRTRAGSTSMVRGSPSWRSKASTISRTLYSMPRPMLNTSKPVSPLPSSSAMARLMSSVWMKSRFGSRLPS